MAGSLGSSRGSPTPVIGSSNEDRFYIFVANDIHYPPMEKVTAEEIGQALLGAGFWAFSEVPSLHPKLKQGDNVLVYLAGYKRRFFCATGVVAGQSRTVTRQQRDVLNRLGLGMMTYGIELAAVSWFDPVRPIRPMVERLEFLRDKRYYGLYLRSPVVKIHEGDYNAVLNCFAGTRQEPDRNA